MSIKREWKVIYKCRSCDSIFLLPRKIEPKWSEWELAEAIRTGKVIGNQGTIYQVEPHKCNDGQIGFGDVIGIRKYKIE